MRRKTGGEGEGFKTSAHQPQNNRCKQEKRRMGGNIHAMLLENPKGAPNPQLSKLVLKGTRTDGDQIH